MKTMIERVQEANKTNVKVAETGYFVWLERKNPIDIHRTDTKIKYLESVFNFVIGEDFLNAEVIAVLNIIEDVYFNLRIRPHLHDRSTA